MKKVSKNLMLYLSVFTSMMVFSGLMFVVYGKITSQVFSNEKVYTVVLDAGHGGEDGGAVGQDGITEKNINLEISKKIRDMLETSGYHVIMTREEDTVIYDDNAETLRQKKRSDLKNRLEMVKSNTGEDSIFVSIHQNKFTDEKYSGAQIFYSKNNAKSQELATNIKDSIVGLIQPNNTREIKPADKNIYLLHNSTGPSVIVECGFLSNAEEAKKLNTKEYQQQLAFSIYCGITHYFMNL